MHELSLGVLQLVLGVHSYVMDKIRITSPLYNDRKPKVSSVVGIFDILYRHLTRYFDTESLMREPAPLNK